ncbi:hypothetical protein ACROAG_01630 [Shewanella oncorhynchi]|uniref:hypothetical protein n=1 Tax=Shewanella oncorhynchi TaxID=2726434 RepID=UPI003D7BDA7D
MADDSAIITTVIPIASWVVIPILTHLINNNRDKKLEHNQTISDIEQLFKDMNESAIPYLSSNSFNIDNYYKLVAYNSQLRLLLNRLKAINKKLVIARNTVITIKKLTTDDQNRQMSKMSEILASQAILLNSIPKNYNTWFL